MDPCMSRLKRELTDRVVGALNETMVQASRIDLRSMVWSHHWPDQRDRCARIGGRHVCRRCLVLYPVTLAMLALSLVGGHWPTRFDAVALFVLPLPVVVDFVGEQVDLFRYSARRQVVTTVLAALALGRAFDRYLRHQGDGTFWSMVLIYGGLCAFTVICRHVRDARIARSHHQRMWERDPLATGFSSRDEFVAYLNASSALSPGSQGSRSGELPRSHRLSDPSHAPGSDPVSRNTTN